MALAQTIANAVAWLRSAESYADLLATFKAGMHVPTWVSQRD